LESGRKVNDFETPWAYLLKDLETFYISDFIMILIPTSIIFIYH